MYFEWIAELHSYRGYRSHKFYRMTVCARTRVCCAVIQNRESDSIGAIRSRSHQNRNAFRLRCNAFVDCNHLMTHWPDPTVAAYDSYDDMASLGYFGRIASDQRLERLLTKKKVESTHSYTKIFFGISSH